MSKYRITQDGNGLYWIEHWSGWIIKSWTRHWCHSIPLCITDHEYKIAPLKTLGEAQNKIQELKERDKKEDKSKQITVIE